MRNPRSRAGMIGCFIAAVLVAQFWPIPSNASCNAVFESGIEGEIFGQFSTYFGAAKNRETETKTEGFPSARENRRFGESDVFVKICDHLNDRDGRGAGKAALILEKSKQGPSVFLHGSVFRLWHERWDVIENWLDKGKRIMSKSAVRPCVFESAATEFAKRELLALFGNGLGRLEALCWNGLYAGYAAMIRQDLTDGSYDGEIERRYGDNQLLVRININALVN